MAQKVTLITGCSTGIGLTMAVNFAKDTAKKYLVYSTMRNLGKQEPLQAAAGDALNDTLFIRPLDVVKDDSVANAVKEIIEEHGRIDLVINNAGIATFNPLEYSNMAEIRDVFETNFFGTVRMMQAVLPFMKEQQSGHIINIGSIAGSLGIPYYDTYCASKFAIDGLTEALAIRLRAFNIKMNIVSPAAVETNINDNMIEGDRLPPRHEIDPISRQQLKILATNQKDHFLTKSQTSEEIADIVRSIVEMKIDLAKMPVRFWTSDVLSDWPLKKYSDFGSANWVNYIRYLIDEPCVSADPKLEQKLSKT